MEEHLLLQTCNVCQRALPLSASYFKNKYNGTFTKQCVVCFDKRKEQYLASPCVHGNPKPTCAVCLCTGAELQRNGYEKKTEDVCKHGTRGSRCGFCNDRIHLAILEMLHNLKRKTRQTEFSLDYEHVYEMILAFECNFECGLCHCYIHITPQAALFNQACLYIMDKSLGAVHGNCLIVCRRCAACKK